MKKKSTLSYELATFCWQDFQMHFPDEELLNFKIQKIKFHWNMFLMVQIRISLYLVKITWTNVDHDAWRHMALLGHNKLILFTALFLLVLQFDIISITVPQSLQILHVNLQHRFVAHTIPLLLIWGFLPGTTNSDWRQSNSLVLAVPV